MYTYSQDPYLSHYGVLGMKWGVRRYQNKDGSLTKAGKKRQAKQAKKFEQKVTKTWTDSYNKATDKMNADLKILNDKYKDIDFRQINPGKGGSAPTKAMEKKWNAYVGEADKLWKKHYKEALLEDYGKHPIAGEAWVDAFMNNTFGNMYEEYKIR